MKISEMVVGQLITARLCLAGADLRKTKSNPPSDFLSMTLTDGTDTLDAKIWNYKVKDSLPETNKAYVFIGTVGDYNGSKQLTVKVMSLAEDQDMTEFSCVYYPDTAWLWNNLEAAIYGIADQKLRDITSFLYNKYKTEVLASSSAKAVHHVGIGGNAFHTLEVLGYAMKITEQARLNNKDISLDLVKAGALLHDIGKIFTYQVNGPVVDITDNGLLFDHIVIGMQLMGEAAQNFDMSYNKPIALLTHIIASHHGQLEYGSPVTPKFAEAYIVNMADGASATLDTLDTANFKAESEGKKLTDKIYTLGNREHFLQTTVAAMLSGHSNTEN